MASPSPLPDPLELFLSKYGFDLGKISEIFTGERYSGVVLNNGNIGVCSGMGEKIPVNKGEYANINLKNFRHRVLLNAYFNAIMNYSTNIVGEPDILKAVDFSFFEKIVMLGFIKPLAAKFGELNISLTIFDLNRDEPELTPISEREKYLAQADAVILSSTAIANGTFLQTVQNSNAGAKIFILGPSSTMTEEFFLYGKVEGVFGSCFEKNDRRVIEIIKNNEGTKKFLKYGTKKGLLKD